MARPLSEAITAIRQTLPEVRKDGQPRRILLTKREEGLVDVLEHLLEHVAIRDGNQAISTKVCRGCSHDRRFACPVQSTHEIIYAMGRYSDVRL